MMKEGNLSPRGMHGPLTCVTRLVTLYDRVCKGLVDRHIMLPGPVLIPFAPQIVRQHVVEYGPQDLVQAPRGGERDIKGESCVEKSAWAPSWPVNLLSPDCGVKWWGMGGGEGTTRQQQPSYIAASSERREYSNTVLLDDFHANAQGSRPC